MNVSSEHKRKDCCWQGRGCRGLWDLGCTSVAKVMDFIDYTNDLLSLLESGQKGG